MFLLIALSVKRFKYFVTLLIKIDNEMKNTNFVFGHLAKTVSFHATDTASTRRVTD